MWAERDRVQFAVGGAIYRGERREVKSLRRRLGEIAGLNPSPPAIVKLPASIDILAATERAWNVFSVNAFAERWVASIRRECLDRILVFGRRHLEHVPRLYPCHTTGTGHTEPSNYGR